jgi:predicted dehydrogenase
MVSALLRFSTGEIGMLDVHWLSPQKIRQLSVVGEGGMFVADYLSQDVYFYKNGRTNDTWTPASNFSGAVEGDMVKTYIPKREPLRIEHEKLVECVVDDTVPYVTGEDGRAALDVAKRLIQSGESPSHTG